MIHNSHNNNNNKDNNNDNNNIKHIKIEVLIIHTVTEGR